MLLPASFWMVLLAKGNRDWTERLVARGYYRYLSSFVSRLVGTVPFSVGEALAIGLPVVALALLVKWVRNLLRRPKARKKALCVAAINLAATLGVFAFLFTVTCGLNYYRQGIAHYLGYGPEAYTTDELHEVCKELAYRANAEKPSSRPSTVREASGQALEAFRKLSLAYPVFCATYGRPKPLYLSKYFSYTQTVGIFSPFTMEANVNVDVPAFTIPANMCHELAHLYGFMREDEANYIAYLACLASEDGGFRYSGVLLALSYALGELYEENYYRYLEVRSLFDDSVLADLYLEREYWSDVERSRYRWSIAEVSSRVADAYLRTNGQSDGVKSYGGMVRFLVAEYRLRKGDLKN